MRILCHAQHFKGVGHFVRMHAIARGLAAVHEVYLVDGGRPVPRPPGSVEPRRLPLPRLLRVGDHLVSAETAPDIPAVLEERTRRLAGAVEQIRPDVVLVDIYPFSKWEMEAEITSAIAVARRVNPGVRVVCSLRDNVTRTIHDQAPADLYPRRVLAQLQAYFDEVLIHADPRFARLEDSFAHAGDISLPIRYTGFVAERPGPPLRPLPAGPYAVLSCGGTTTNLEFLLAAIKAFRHLSARGPLGSMSLLVFPGPVGEAALAALRAATRGDQFRLLGFVPEFDGWLAGSDLSVSRAGYNTVVQLLASPVPRVVVPNPDSSDQPPRGRRLAQLGLATVVDRHAPSAAAIAAAIEKALSHPPPRCTLDLEGIAATRAILEGSRGPDQGGAVHHPRGAGHVE